MRAIRQRYLIFICLCGLAFFVSFAIITFSRRSFITVSYIDIVVSVFLASLFLFLSIRGYRDLVFAQLIVDNKIIHIRAVQSEQRSWKHDTIIFSADSMDIYVSCFGILLGSKIIKFNTEGIHLEKIDIGKDFIDIYFGKGDREQLVRLLNNITDNKELLHIIEQFQRETGVIPKIVA